MLQRNHKRQAPSALTSTAPKPRKKPRLKLFPNPELEPQEQEQEHQHELVPQQRSRQKLTEEVTGRGDLEAKSQDIQQAVIEIANKIASGENDDDRVHYTGAIRGLPYDIRVGRAQSSELVLELPDDYAPEDWIQYYYDAIRRTHGPSWRWTYAESLYYENLGRIESAQVDPTNLLMRFSSSSGAAGRDVARCQSRDFP